MKAFGSITHKSIWSALKSCGIEQHYISLLKKLYRDQKATVLTVTCSRSRKEPNRALPSLLFNTTLQKALEEDIPRWQKKKGMGIYLSDNDHDCFTNMRFVDDVLLLASSEEQQQKMLHEFKNSTEKVGLRIHPGKRKILSNQSSDTRKEIEIDDIKVEILARGESTKDFGQMISFQQQETTEIRNRITTVWATFHKYRKELTSRNYLLKHRLRLFDAVVITTMSYTSGT